jgi:hypothetical protein
MYGESSRKPGRDLLIEELGEGGVALPCAAECDTRAVWAGVGNAGIALGDIRIS